MALSSAQKLQFLRLPVVDASVSTDDKYAFLGVILTVTTAGTLPEALRKQILRLPIVDASVTTSDKFALLGLMESADSGALYELFETAWLVDPTWEADELPTSNVGQMLVEIAGFISGFAGSSSLPEATGSPDLVAIQIPLTRVKEETAFTATVYFRDRATSSALSPVTVRYRIDCKTTRKKVQDWTSIAAGSTISIPILPRHNRIKTFLAPDRMTERKQLIVESNTDTSTASLGKVIWSVVNVFGVD